MDGMVVVTPTAAVLATVKAVEVERAKTDRGGKEAASGTADQGYSQNLRK